MKKMIRVVLASSMVLFLGGVGKGWAGNTATITQTQFTTGPYSGCGGCSDPGSSLGNGAGIIQLGDLNSASITQSGAGISSLVDQVGFDNIVATTIEGSDADTLQSQIGDFNTATILSGDVVTGAFPAGTDNIASDVKGFASQTQEGNDNSAVLVRHTNFGFGDLGCIPGVCDPAFANFSAQSQSGDGNGSSIFQKGDQHFAFHTQIGDLNSAISTQEFVGDSVAIIQVGTGNFASTLQ